MLTSSSLGVEAKLSLLNSGCELDLPDRVEALRCRGATKATAYETAAALTIGVQVAGCLNKFSALTSTAGPLLAVL
eukprot:1979464-Pleurochrysis_carterae.AAC.1